MSAAASSSAVNHAHCETSTPSATSSPADHSRIENDGDVGALVTVGIRHLEVRAAERGDQPGQLDLEPGLLTRLANRRFCGGLTGLDCAADSSPLLAVDLVDQEQPAEFVADVHRDGGKQ